MIFVATIAFCPLAQAQPKPVTFTSVAKRLELLLPELSNAAGVRLTAASPVSDDVLVIKVKDAPLDVLMAKIAEASWAAWEKTKDGYRLVRTAAMERDQQEKELTERATAIKAAIEAKRGPALKDPFTDAAAKKLALEMKIFDVKEDDPNQDSFAKYQMMWKVADRAPVGRAVLRLLSMIDPMEIAALPGYTAGVYCTRPNRLQRAFSGQTDAILTDLVREQQLWCDAVAANPLSRDGIRMGGDPRAQDQPIARPDKIILSIGCYNRLSEFTVTMYALDAQGKTILASNGRIPSSWSDTYMKMMRAVQDKPVGGPDFTLSPENLEFARLTSTPRPEFARPALTDAWLRKLSSPETVDPLSFGASECLMEMAKRKGAQLVACPSDRFMSLDYNVPVTGKLSLAALATAMPVVHGVDVAVKDGWMVAKPNHPVLERRAKAPRKAFGVLVRSLVAQGYPSLAAMGEFALVADQEATWPALFAYGAAVLPHSERLLQFTNWSACKLYGSLSVQQRASLDGGDTLSGAMLSSTSRALLQHMLLYDTSDTNRVVHAANERGSLRPAEDNPVETEIMRDLQPGAIQIRWKLTDQAAALVGTKGNAQYTPWTYVEGAERIGGMIARDPLVNGADFWFGRKRQIAISIIPNPNWVLDSHLEEDVFNLSAAPLTLGQLPADFKKAIDTATKNSAGSISRSRQQPPPARI